MITVLLALVLSSLKLAGLITLTWSTIAAWVLGLWAVGVLLRLIAEVLK